MKAFAPSLSTVAAAASSALVVVDSDDDVPRVQPQGCEVLVAGTLFAEELARMATLEKHRDEFATWDLEKQNAWLFQTLSGMARSPGLCLGLNFRARSNGATLLAHVSQEQGLQGC